MICSFGTKVFSHFLVRFDVWFLGARGKEEKTGEGGGGWVMLAERKRTRILFCAISN